MTLTNLALQILKGNRALIRKIAEVVGVKEGTVAGWVRNGSDNMTKLAVLDCLQRETGLGVEQLVERGTKVISETP